MSTGLPGRSVFGFVAFSPDGRKVAYPRETNNTFLRTDIYVYDRVARTNTLATPAVVGAGGSNNTPSRVYGFHPTDSNRLLFSSTASNLVAKDTDGQEDVFIRDLGRRTTTLVSINAAGTASANRVSTEARWLGSTKVAFISSAEDLGPRDTNTWADIYVRDLTAGTTTLVSTNAAGDDAGNGQSGVYKPWVDVQVEYKALSVSPDGTRIAFGSDANDLGPTDTVRSYQEQDIYVASVAAPQE
jgi:Tol biopolymer transport system component